MFSASEPTPSEPGPWIHGWGRGALVRSDRDVAGVLQLLSASDGDERAVVFERLTRQQRHSLIRQLEANGISVRPFDDGDKQRASDRDVTLPGKLQTIVALLLAWPYLLTLRVRGRTTEMYAARRAEMT